MQTKNIGVLNEGTIFGHENFWKKEKLGNLQASANMVSTCIFWISKKKLENIVAFCNDLMLQKCLKEHSEMKYQWIIDRINSIHDY